MGPKIISFVKGETRYSLRLFPIGGTVPWKERMKTVKKKVLLITQKFGRE